jgi:hypothetical protein
MAVRRESVRLELEDAGFSTGMAKNAAATALLNRELHDLDGTSSKAGTSVSKASRDIDGAGTTSKRTSDSINQLTGRLRLLTDAALTLGPAVIPLGGAAVVGVAGLAAQLGAAAGAAGVAIAALNGVGDALQAVNKYQLEPTADNLAKVQQEFDKLGPAGANFVVFLEQITPQLRELQMTAREGFLPGLQDGISLLLTRGPQVNAIIADLSSAMGDLSESAGRALAGDRFDAFFSYLESDAGPLLMELGRSIGYITEGLANMMVAFSPAAADFSGGMEDMARSFAEWSRSLDSNQAFQEFLSYIRTNGPAAIDFLGSLVQALASVVEAAAPIGAAILPVLTTLLDLFASLAGTDVGTTVLAAAAAMAAYSRAATIASAANTRLQASFWGVDRSAASAKNSLLGMGRSMGIVAAAMVTLQTGSNIWDSLSRSFEAGDKAAGSLTELEEALANSNLGKYAQDLGIDVQRLAQDLAVSGTEGEYYQRVLEQLGGAADGFGGKVNALSDFIGPWIGDTEQASLANLDLGKIVRGNTDLLGKVSDETVDAADAQMSLAQEADGAATNLDKLRSRLQAARTELKQSRQSAREVAESFVGLGDSLNDSDKSLGSWLSELERNAAALRAFQRNAKEAARNGLDEGLIASLQQAGSEGALRMRQLANATDSEIARANRAWRNGQGAVKDFVDEVGGVKPKYVTRLEAQVEGAMADLARLRAQLDIPDEYVNVWVTRREVNAAGGPGPQMPNGSADGGTVPKTGKPYADRHHYLLADGEEVISNRRGQADKWRPLLKAINAGRLADGGTAGGNRSLEDLLDIAQITQNIRGLQRSLRADGKDRLEGLNRRIAELQLRLAEQELRLAKKREEREARADAREERKEKRQELQDKANALAGIGAGLSFDSLVPREMSFSERMRAELEDFKDSILDAGGVWDEGMQSWASDMMTLANQYQSTSEAIEREEQRRNELVKTLNEQQQQLDSLNRTMEAYASTVASQFLSNPFGSRTETVAGAPGAASAALASAQAQLAAIRSGANADSPAAAAEASRLIAEIARLQSAADAETQDSTRTVGGLDFLRETLLGDTNNANRMAQALSTLVSKGLDANGAFGGLFQQFASSGDLVTAEQLAALTAEQIDEYEKLFKAREDAAATVGALATQEVYGQQQEQLQGLIEATNAAIAQSDATLVVLNAQLAVLGEQVRAGAATGVAGLAVQLAAIQGAIAAIPRVQSENDRKRTP